ncbi:SIR2 family NAD-dependent protein deacylase [Lacticaseibacillus saniviri]
METLQTQLQQLKQMIDSHHHIVALTGAGISTSAGINDLIHTSRETSSTLASEAVLESDPARFYQSMHQNFLDPIFNNGPTVAHRALAQLEKSGHLDAVVTTNVDYLHELAGNTKVADIWYSFNENYCLTGKHEYSIETLNQPGIPRCPVDGTLISPGPTYHHIGTLQTAIQNAIKWMNAADLVLVIGSNGYYDRVNTQVPMIQINPEPTEFDLQATLNIRATADEVLKDYVN